MKPPATTPLRFRRIFLAAFVGLLLLAAFRAILQRRPDPATDRPPLTRPASTLAPAVLDAFLAIEQRERTVLTQAWRLEEQARIHGEAIETFWNHLNRQRGELKPLLELPLRSLTVPTLGSPEDLPFSITAWTAPTGAASVRFLPANPRVSSWLAEGWGLDQSEWRHVRYEPASDPTPPRSTFEVHLHLSRSNPPARVQISAQLVLSWSERSGGTLSLATADGAVEQLVVLRRDGPPPFEEQVRFEVPPFPRTTWIDPLIVPPPRGGVSAFECFLAARNLRVSRKADGQWTTAPLAAHHPGLVFTALHADFDGDGLDDFLFVVRNGLLLLPGGTDLSFDQPPKPAWLAPQRLQYAQALTCGDADGDGDLDVFLGQYRAPYESGQMPRPYFDALDGPPAYFLRNRGDGRFEDATLESGLAAKRHRRSYGASFVDWDADGDLDLLVSSDFAGSDLYANDGNGRFEDRTTFVLDEPRSFGMSHFFSDFDADGRLDFFVAGMPQPTAQRLDGLGLERPAFESWQPERARITAGNRLYFGSPTGFHQRPVSRDVARAGWAWSAVDLDLDHDRFPELVVVNGHETRESVRDYEREFWLHDIYVGQSNPDPAVDAYFSSKFASSRAQGWSYGGYEKNRLFLNLAGTRFVEAAHVLGLALEDDCRNVLAEDVDADGDLDLLVTTFAVWPAPKQTLRILENTLPGENAWVEVLAEGRRGGRPPPGTSVSMKDQVGHRIRPVVVGEGYRSQGSGIVRFGLGSSTNAVEVEVRWPGGGIVRTNRVVPGMRHRLRRDP